MIWPLDFSFCKSQCCFFSISLWYEGTWLPCTAWPQPHLTHFRWSGTPTVSQALSATSVPDLTYALGAEWDKICAARSQNLEDGLCRKVEAIIAADWCPLCWTEMFGWKFGFPHTVCFALFLNVFPFFTVKCSVEFEHSYINKLNYYYHIQCTLSDIFTQPTHSGSNPGTDPGIIFSSIRCRIKHTVCDVLCNAPFYSLCPSAQSESCPPCCGPIFWF